MGIFASGGTNYSWSTGATTSHITDAPSTTTTYTVTATNTAGCTGATTITITVHNCTTSISEIYSSDLKILVSPNPFSESAVVSVLGQEENQSYEMKIFDMLGDEVRRIYFAGKQTAIDRGYLSEGIYFYKIETIRTRASESATTGKFIISLE